MAGRIKHMERSHRSHKNKGMDFRRFNIKASQSKYSKAEKATMVDKIKSIFKRQAKGDK